MVDVLTYFKKEEEAAPGEELWTRGAGPPQPLQTVTLVLALCFVTLMWNRFIIYINTHTYLNKICNKFICINILYVSRKGLFMSKVSKVGAYIYIELWPEYDIPFFSPVSMRVETGSREQRAGSSLLSLGSDMLADTITCSHNSYFIRAWYYNISKVFSSSSDLEMFYLKVKLRAPFKKF